MSKVVALEIASNAIRAAEVSGYKGKKPKLLRTGEIKLEVDVAGESQVHDGEALAEALRQLWIQSKFSTRNAGLIVSGRRFIVRPHTTGQSSIETLRKILPFEAPNAFPDQVSDLLFDFYPTHSVDTKAGVKTDGLVISSPSEPISELAFALNRAKLNLEFVDFTPLAVTRWIKNNRPEQNYALVNIREESTDIALVEGGMPRTVRVLSKGLNSKRRRLGATGADHSPLLRRDVLGENGVKVLVQDIGLTISTQSGDIAGELECIFTSGPRAEDPELRSIIAEQFGIPVIPLYIESISQDENEELNLKPSFDEFVAMTGAMR